MNRSKAKGTRAETAVVAYLRGNGFPHAERRPLAGSRDGGDIAVCPGIICEVKDAASLYGRPGPALMRSWMAQTERERDNAGAKFAFLVVKRPRTGVGTWSAYWRDDLIGYTLSTMLADLVRKLRTEGWGNP